MRKALREQSRGERQGGPAGSGQRGGAPAPWSKHRQIMNHRQPICVQMVGDHQQSVGGAASSSSSAAGAAVVCGGRDDPCGAKTVADSAGGGMLQNFNEYLDLSYHPVAQAGDYTILPDIDQSSWYPYLQGPVQNQQTYLMRTGPDKVASSEWSNFSADNSTAFIHTNSQNAVDRDGNGNANGGYIGSREQLTVNGGTHHSQQHISVTSPSEQDKVQDQANHDGKLQESMLGANMVDSKTLLDLPQIKTEIQNGVDNGNGNKDVLRLPGFHQAFGSTEIGRFSQHDEFFEVSMPQPEPQQETKVSVPPAQPGSGKRGRTPRGGARKTKAKEEKHTWPQEHHAAAGQQPSSQAMVKKEVWPESNGVVPLPLPSSLMNSPARGNCYPPYGSDEHQPGYGQQWPPAHLQDQPNCYYPHHPQAHYGHQPYYNQPPQTPQHQQDVALPSMAGMPAGGRGGYRPPDCGDYYPPYPPQNCRTHPYYHQHHFPHQNNNIPPSYYNNGTGGGGGGGGGNHHPQYNDYHQYGRYASGMSHYQSHPHERATSWGMMNRDFKMHNYSSGLV